MVLVDTHAHLQMTQFDSDRDEAVRRAQEASVRFIINVGWEVNSSREAVELAGRYPGVFAAVGVHPHEAKIVDEAGWRELEELVASPGVVALGECGLDYHYEHSPKEVQREVFRRQLELAARMRLPVIVHQREAEDEALEILEEAALRQGGVVHCFSGTREYLEAVLGLGLYVSFGGPVTYPRAENLRELVRLVPDSRLLLETDAPYLAPQNFRGRRNEPAYLRLVAEFVAGLRGISLADVCRITSLNAGILFGIPSGDLRPKVVYRIRDALYVNLTCRCTNNCTFCGKRRSYVVKGHNLKLEQEPSAAEVIQALNAEPKGYQEVVFCGYGEPTLRLAELLEVARYAKAQGLRVRLNTNGQGSLIHGEDILPQLVSCVDVVSVSLNAPDERTYFELCQPEAGIGAYGKVVEFIRKAKALGLEVVATVVALPGLDVALCRKKAEGELGVRLRVREYNVLG